MAIEGVIVINPADGTVTTKTGCAGEVFDALEAGQSYGTLAGDNPLAFAICREQIANIARAAAKLVPCILGNFLVPLVPGSANAAVNTALIVAAATSGFAAELPAGTYYVNHTAITGVTGCRIFGQGMGVTNLVLGSAVGGSALSLDSCDNIQLDNFSLSGAGLAAFGIEAASVSSFWVRDVEVFACDQGIRIAGGTNRRIFLQRLHVHHMRYHGIYYTSVSGVSSGDGWTDLVAGLISDCFVWQFGLDMSTGGSAGIYVDKTSCISNCNISAFGTDVTGTTVANSSIGILLGDADDTANRSSVVNCFIFPNLRGNGVEGSYPDFDDATEGIRVDANNCQIVSCSPHGSFWGVRVRGSRNRVSHCVADQCAYGFFAEDGAGFTRFSYCLGTGSVGPGIGFQIDADSCWAQDCYARLNATYGVAVGAAATNATIFGCDLTSNTTGPVADGGSGTRILYNVGAESMEFLSLGSDPSTNGLVRLGANQGGVKFRNSAAFNTNGMDMSASDNLVIGHDANVNRLDLYGANGMRVHTGLTLEFEVFAGTVDAKDNLLRTTSTVRGGAFDFGSGLVSWRTGSGSPEGVVTAPIGSLYSRTDGGAGTCLYVKESGVSNTGWIPK